MPADVVVGGEVPVEAPPLQEPVTGLLAQAPVIDGPQAQEWLRGMAFAPESARELESAVLCAAVELGLDDDVARLALRKATPFDLVVRDRCSTWGFSENDYVGRATRALDVKRHHGLEREFEEGAIVPGNLHLAETYSAPDPTTTTLAGGNRVSPVNALALLDEAIADARIGRGMIHATAFVVALWKAAGLLSTDTIAGDSPPQLYSPKGNIIIAGNGYQGRGPAGTIPAGHTGQWAYATDWIVVVAGSPETIPNTLAEATDKARNQVVYQQHQWFAILWAGLLHAAVQVGTDTPAVAGESGGSGGSGQTTTMMAEDSTPLAGSATRNGATYPTDDYAKFRAFASSDVAGTLNIQQSRTGTTWYTTTTAAVAPGSTSGTVLESIIAMPFVRAQYVNGAAPQTAFEFDTALIGS